MKLRSIGFIQAAELLIAVIPTTIIVGPLLLIWSFVLIAQTVPDILRGHPLRDPLDPIVLFFGPIGILALISLCLLILFGPEQLARRRYMRILVARNI